MRRSGFIGAFVPEELGGLGLDSVHDWCAGLDRLGRGDPSTAIAINMHFGTVRNIASAWQGARNAGNAALVERTGRTLKAVAAGELLFCGTATEPGTDNLRPRTTATRIEGGWSITGRKIFVTLSPIADVCGMNVRIVDEAGDRIGFAQVPVNAPGFLPQDDWDALGMRASGSQSVVFDDCRVSEHAVTVAGPWGRWTPGSLLSRTIGNLTLVAVFLGIAERARELAVAAARTNTKVKLGGALGLLPGVQHLLGEMDIELATARAVLSVTARDLDALLARGAPPTLEEGHAIMRDYQCAKWTVNQNAISIVSKAMDVVGGGAFTSQNELSRLYRDVRAGPFMQPFSPTELHSYVGQVAAGIPPEG
jgi:alkylation response protein AidB-like acyl-CoA dehydrogenase